MRRELMLDGMEPEQPPFTPDEAWIDAFKKQCTSQLREAAKRYATRRARGVGKAGGNADDYYARELVQDALSDTLLGVVAWDPNAHPLESHVLDVIRYRTRHDRKRAAKYRHVSVDVFDPGAEMSTTRGEIEGSLRANQGTTADESMAAAEVLARVREIACSDKSALRLLDAIEAGAATKADIMHVAAMSAKSYRNARDRLSRHVKHLDQQSAASLRQA